MLTIEERRQIIDLLHHEVVPAMGCTEPVAVALCAARAAELLGMLPERVEVELSMNVKNSNSNIDKLENNIDAVRNNLKAVEEKSKFDIMTWIRDNFVNVVLTIGVISYLVTQIIK